MRACVRACARVCVRVREGRRREGGKNVCVFWFSIIALCFGGPGMSGKGGDDGVIIWTYLLST